MLTYAGQAASAAAHLAEHPDAAIRLVPVAHPFERARHARGGRPRTTIPEQVHYYVWQVLAARTARRLHREVGFDVVHHITFGKCWAPSAGAFVDAPFVLGPVGGGESAPLRFWPGFSLYGDRLRGLAQRGAAGRAAGPPRAARLAALVARHRLDRRATARAMARLGARATAAQPSIGLTDDEVERLRALSAAARAPLRILMSGRLLHWKGFDMGLRALAAAGLHRRARGLVGVGPERNAAGRLARRLGLDVTFHGLLPR